MGLDKSRNASRKECTNNSGILRKINYLFIYLFSWKILIIKLVTYFAFYKTVHYVHGCKLKHRYNISRFVYAYNCEILDTSSVRDFLLFRKKREGERRETERVSEWNIDSIPRYSARFHRTIVTALHDALKLQSTRKTVWIPSWNYSKRRSLRSRSAHPPSSSPTFPALPSKSHLSLKRTLRMHTIYETLDARQWPNFTRRFALREKSLKFFLYIKLSVTSVVYYISVIY